MPNCARFFLLSVGYIPCVLESCVGRVNPHCFACGLNFLRGGRGLRNSLCG